MCHYVIMTSRGNGCDESDANQYNFDVARNRQKPTPVISMTRS